MAENVQNPLLEIEKLVQPPKYEFKLQKHQGYVNGKPYRVNRIIMDGVVAKNDA